MTVPNRQITTRDVNILESKAVPDAAAKKDADRPVFKIVRRVNVIVSFPIYLCLLQTTGTHHGH